MGAGSGRASTSGPAPTDDGVSRAARQSLPCDRGTGICTPGPDAGTRCSPFIEDDRVAASAAHVLSRHRCVGALLDVVKYGGRARLWALSALGDLSPDLVREAVGGTLDEETELALEPLWLSQHDWLRRDEGRDGLEALDVQTVRFDPVDLAVDKCALEPWRKCRNSQ